MSSLEQLADVLTGVLVYSSQSRNALLNRGWVLDVFFVHVRCYSAGPMSTLHFENMRDGFEDHAYLALLRSLCPDSTKDTVIPTRLFQETQPDPSPINRTFSEHPGDLRAWRNIVGKAIEAALANGTCDQP
eukprot:COSAG05_NODE_178_length_14897_cov_619.335248_10_plen_131_part_00